MSISTKTPTATSTPIGVTLEDRKWEADALQSVWERQRELVDERIGLIASAVAALGEDRLREETRQSARRVAHMLAGSLGMFGFVSASSTAASLELGLEHPTGADAPTLSALVLDLRRQTLGAVNL